MLVVPVFAASDYEDEAKTLYDLGLFKGKSETAYEPALEDRLLREEGVALLLRIFNLEDEALAMDQAEAENLLKQKFSDAGEIAAWAVKYIAYAVKNNIVAGRPDGKFAPKDNLLGREYAKMVLALLGYVQGEDFEYKFSIAEFAEKTGFSKSEASRMDEAFLLRGDVVGMSYAALSAEYKTGPNAGKKVIDVIVEGDEEKKAVAIAAGLIEEAVIVSLETLYDIEINVGETLNLPNQVKAFYSDGTTAMLDVAWPTVDNTKAMPKTEIEGVVSDTDLKAKINVTIKEAQLRVVSVSTDNLTQVKVEYNLDVTTNAEVAKKDNYTLSTGKIDTVSASGKVAVLNLTKDSVPNNQTNAKLTISDKILGSKQEFEFKYFDATLPQVVGFEATGPKEFTAYFDEPIKDKGTVTVKSGTSTLSVNVSGIGEGTDAVKIPLYSTLADGKDYDITIQGFKDYAGFENIVKSLTYTYVKDTSAPVATIKSAKQECVEVEFNKPVSGIIREMFSHTFTAWIATQVTSDADGNNLVDHDDSYSKVYAWFYTGEDDVDRPIPEGETTFRILGKATVTNTSTSYEIKDLWGNKFETADFTIAISADKTAPEVKEIKVTEENQITVEFTKTVTFGKDNIEVLDEEGKAIDGLTLSFDPTTAATKFTVTFSKGLAGKTIIVNIKNVYDATLNSNKLDLYSTTLDVSDTTPPEVEYIRWDKGDYLYI
ncbi:MAG: hypothetical protein GX754_02855, partial [Clostridiaceae bacterium]|nr:hypothetical protein [Clostridiaceae bacterium]